jgi:alpha-tubulin suppressor-like RCC1 family protein
LKEIVYDTFIKTTNYIALWRAICLVSCALCVDNTHGQSTNSVLVWGDNGFGETNVPPNLTNCIAVAGGIYECLALESNGEVTNWGAGSYLAPGFSNVIAIADNGEGYSLGLRNDATIVGQNALNLTNVVAIASLSQDDAALLDNGTVTVWGGNVQWGITNVPPDATNVVEIAGGQFFTLALRCDGTVVGWGGFIPEATNVPVNLSNVVQVAAGDSFGLALKLDGTVTGWGDAPPNTGGVVVPPGLTNIEAIAACHEHALALKADGTVIAWGAGGTNGDDAGESIVPPGLSNVVAIAAGYQSSMAIMGSGQPAVSMFANELAYSAQMVVLRAYAMGGFPLSYQWQFDGTNIAGATMPWLMLTNVPAAGSGTYTVVVSNSQGIAINSTALVVTNSPPIILAQPTDLAIPPDNNPTFSVAATGSMPLSYQWQFNGTNIAGATSSSLTLTNAQLSAAGIYTVNISNAYGSISSSNVNLAFVETSVAEWGAQYPAIPTNLIDVVAVAGGGSYCMALKANGTAVDWGPNRLVPRNWTNIISIATCVGTLDCLGLKADGTVLAAGSGAEGQTNVPPGLTNVVAIACGTYHCLALKSDGTVVAWGGGQTNNPSDGYDYGQAIVPQGLTNVMAIAAGYFHSLALKNNGTVVAWGDNVNGATNVPPGLTNVIAIGAGPNAMCCFAVKSDGTLTIWGSTNGLGVPLGLSNVVSVTASQDACFALLANRSVVAWGNNFYGETNVPSGLTNVTQVSAGEFDALVLDPAGGVITLNPSQGAGQGQVGYLQATLAPPAAVAAGAGWGILGEPYFSSSTNFTLAITATQSVELAFQPVNNWIVPTSRAVNVPLGGVTNLNISYSVPSPVMYASSSNGLGITGTTNTSYIIQYCTNLAGVQWLTLTTNTLGPGINKIVSWPPKNHGSATFYRALWLP